MKSFPVKKWKFRNAAIAQGIVNTVNGKGGSNKFTKRKKKTLIRTKRKISTLKRKSKKLKKNRKSKK